MFKRLKDDNPALTIWVIALSIQIIFSFAVFPLISGPMELGDDPDQYGVLARNWVDGVGYVFEEGQDPTVYRGPGYTSLVASVYIIFGDDGLLPVLALMQCLFGAATAVATYIIGRRLFSLEAGMLAGLAVAAHPLIFWFTPRLRYEPLFVMLLTLSVLAAVNLMRERRPVDIVATGLLFAAAALTQQIALLVLPAMAAGFVLFTSPRWPLIRAFTVATIIMIVCVIPWTMRNYQVSEEFVPVHAGGITQLVKGHYEYLYFDQAPYQSVELAYLAEARLAEILGEEPNFDLRMPGVEQALRPYAIDLIVNNPGTFITRTLTQVHRYWYMSESPFKSAFLAVVQFIYLIPTVLGLIYSVRTGRYEVLVLLVPVIIFNLIYAATHVEARYSAPVLPYISVLAGVGAWWVSVRMQERFFASASAADAYSTAEHRSAQLESQRY